MQSATTTRFKQKKCPKCGNNHDNEGILCSFCIDKANIARSKIQLPPADFWVKCLIEREGNTTTNIGNIQYTFKPNKHGDCVCEIINQGHYTQILKSEFYEPYVNPGDEAAVEIPVVVTPVVPVVPAAPVTPPAAPVRPPLFTDEEAAMISILVEAGKNNVEIAAALTAQGNGTIPWQRVMKYLTTKTE